MASFSEKNIQMLLLQVFYTLWVWYWQSLGMFCSIDSSSLIGRKRLTSLNRYWDDKKNYKLQNINWLSMSVKHETEETTAMKTWALQPLTAMGLLYSICVACGEHSPIVLYVLLSLWMSGFKYYFRRNSLQITKPMVSKMVTSFLFIGFFPPRENIRRTRNNRRNTLSS